MPEMDTGTAQVRAAEIMQSMAAREVVHDGRLLPKVTTSVGLASYPDHGESPETLLTQADQALYQAKSNGRNQVVVASSE